MKTVKLYLMPLSLAILSLLVLNNTIAIKKETEIQKAKINVNTAKIDSKVQVSGDNLITAQHEIQSFAKSNELPVSVTLEKNILKIAPNIKDTSEAKNVMLGKYENIMAFLKDISALPNYSMQLNSYCIGEDCNNGMEAMIEVKGVNNKM